jgi:hypothetical protein
MRTDRQTDSERTDRREAHSRFSQFWERTKRTPVLGILLNKIRSCIGIKDLFICVFVDVNHFYLLSFCK